MAGMNFGGRIPITPRNNGVQRTPQPSMGGMGHPNGGIVIPPFMHQNAPPVAGPQMTPQPSMGGGGMGGGINVGPSPNFRQSIPPPMNAPMGGMPQTGGIDPAPMMASRPPMQQGGLMAGYGGGSNMLPGIRRPNFG
jgi:hypothetical protein